MFSNSYKYESQEIECIFGTYHTVLIGTSEELRKKLLECEMTAVFLETKKLPAKALIGQKHPIREEDVDFLLNYEKGEIGAPVITEKDWVKKWKDGVPGEISVIDKKLDTNEFVVFKGVRCGYSSDREAISWIGIVVKKEKDLGKDLIKIIDEVRGKIQHEYTFHQKALALSKKVKNSEFTEITVFSSVAASRSQFLPYVLEDKTYYVDKSGQSEDGEAHTETVDERAVVLAVKGDKDIFDYKMLKW